MTIADDECLAYAPFARLHNLDNLPEEWFDAEPLPPAKRTVLMDEAARSAFEAYPDADVVEVYEHAGWFLTYRRDGTIVGTANDGWAVPAEIRDWWADVELKSIASIRR